MAAEALSMRQTAKELGISQLRVRELIKKGRLEADKVSDDAGEHWEITRSSVEDFRAERSTDSPNGRAPAPAAAPGPHLAVLLPELEQQLDRVKALVQEISRAHSYLSALRETQVQLELEIDAVRRGMESAEPEADEPEPEAPAPEEPAPEEKAESEKATEKASAPKKSSAKKSSGKAKKKTTTPKKASSSTSTKKKKSTKTTAKKTTKKAAKKKASGKDDGKK